MIRVGLHFKLQPKPTLAQGLAAVTGEHYEGGHWLGSFAVYLTTQRGIEHANSTRARRD